MRVNEPITDKEILMPENETIVSGTDPGGRITFVNRTFCAVSGFLEEELIGKPHNIVRHPHMPKVGFANLWATIKAGRPWDGLVKNRAKSGDFYWVRANVTPVTENGRITGYISIRERPSREEVALAEAIYARIQAGDSRGLDLRDGALVEVSLRSRLAEAWHSLGLRLAIAMAATILGLAVTFCLGSLGMDAGSERLRSACRWAAAGTALTSAGLAAGFGWLLWTSVQRTLGNVIRDLQALAADDSSYKVQPPKVREFWAAGRMVRAVQARMAYARHAHAETQRAVEEARASAERAMAETVERASAAVIQHIEEQSGETLRNADDVAGAASRVDAQAREVGSAAQSSLLNAQTVGAAAEELAASVQEISAQMSRASATAKLAVEKSESVRERIRSLADLAENIGAVVSLIGEVAGKTNLLALNATIEAARAGEAGKGFAVVAAEVKSLANQTARSTNEIRSQVAAIQAASKSAAHAVEEIGESIHATADVAIAVAAAVEEQAAATAEIARSAFETASAARHVSDSINEVSRDAAETGRLIEAMRQGALAMAQWVMDLEKVVVQTVRSATTHADRRREVHVDAADGCVLENAVGTRCDAALMDISPSGAAVAGATGFAPGDRGIMRFKNCGPDARVPFEVRSVGRQGDLHLHFLQDQATQVGRDAIARLIAKRKTAAAMAA